MGKNSRGHQNNQRLLNFHVGGGGNEFHYGGDTPSASSSSRRPSHHRRGTAASRHEGYLLSNYRVGLRRSALPQLSKCLRLNDPMLEWEAIDQVVMWGDFEEHRCPICIDQPRAARVTTCGHVFCLPCLLQYRQQMREDKKPLVCPLCQHSISLSQLKLVSIVPTRLHRENDTVVFSFVKRWREGVLTFVGDDVVLRKNEPPPALSESARFSRYYLLQQGEVLDLLSRDMAELQQCMEDALDEEDATYTLLLQEALQMVQEQCALIGADEVVVTQGDKPFPAAQLLSCYQASDGQYYFISPFCVRMMSHHVATLLGMGEESSDHLPLEVFPNEIQSKILHVEQFQANEGTAKRFRFAAHLPPGTQFSVVDVCMDGLVGEETRVRFGAEVEARSARWREEKARVQKEEKRTARLRRAGEEQRRTAKGAGFVDFPSAPEAFEDDGPPPALTDMEAFPTLPGAESPLDQALPDDDDADDLTEEEPLPPAPSMSPVEIIPRRIDDKDGKCYTKAEFLEFYGNLDQWEKATEVCNFFGFFAQKKLTNRQRQSSRLPLCRRYKRRNVHVTAMLRALQNPLSGCPNGGRLPQPRCVFVFFCLN